MSSYAGYVVETFVTLLVVSAIAFIVLYGARRLGVGRALGRVRLVGQLPLEPKRSIYLVEVAGRVLVVGACEGGMTKLAEITSAEFNGTDESSAPLTGNPDRSSPGPAGETRTRFADALARAIGPARTAHRSDVPKPRGDGS